MKISTLFIAASLFLGATVNAQVFEWRLVNPTFNPVDPDGAGPATGSATFTMQIHTVSGSVPDVSVISVGWNYQSAFAMIPTSPFGPGCPSTISNPANVTVSPAFLSGGYAFTTVNQCGDYTQVAGGVTFDKRAVGTLDGTGVAIGTAWVDVYTVTLWTLGGSSGGYVSINSGAGGSPGEFTTYEVADVSANPYVANSLTFNIPLQLGNVLPVTFTKVQATCTSTGALITWSTASELNSSYYTIEKSYNGTNWSTVAKVAAAGHSSAERSYQQIDLNSKGNTIYRIKQVDTDGQFAYTDIVRTNCATRDITSLIYPVPARDRLNIVIKADRSMKTVLQVFDGAGKIVRKQDIQIQAGNNNYYFLLANLPAGTYSLRSTDPSLNLQKTFTIVR